jgi:hypothetical protein
VRIWTEERPAKTDVEAIVCRHFNLLRAGKIPEAEQLVDHLPVRHVLKSLWAGSVGANADADEASCSPAQTIEVSLGFWVKPTDAGWVVAGPSALWWDRGAGPA